MEAKNKKESWETSDLFERLLELHRKLCISEARAIRKEEEAQEEQKNKINDLIKAVEELKKEIKCERCSYAKDECICEECTVCGKFVPSSEILWGYHDGSEGICEPCRKEIDGSRKALESKNKELIKEVEELKKENTELKKYVVLWQNIKQQLFERYPELKKKE